jgi:cytochrome c556
MRHFLVGLLCVAIPGGTSVFAAEPAAKTEPPRKPILKQGLEAPTYLSPLARQLLKQRMKRHGTDMLAMLRAVLFLDHESTQRLAAELAAEPRLTRAIAGGADDLNAALPERFFVLQDELRSRALDLAAAAKEANDARLAARLGDVTQTCVSCHSTYLEPRSQPLP